MTIGGTKKIKAGFSAFLTAAVLTSALFIPSSGVGKVSALDEYSAAVPTGEYFDVYYGENASVDGLYPAEFDERFTAVNDTYIQHNFDTSKVTNMWAQCDSFITTALYNGKA